MRGHNYKKKLFVNLKKREIFFILLSAFIFFYFVLWGHSFWVQIGNATYFEGRVSYITGSRSLGRIVASAEKVFLLHEGDEICLTPKKQLNEKFRVNVPIVFEVCDDVKKYKIKNGDSLAIALRVRTNNWLKSSMVKL